MVKFSWKLNEKSFYVIRVIVNKVDGRFLNVHVGLELHVVWKVDSKQLELRIELHDFLKKENFVFFSRSKTKNLQFTS